MRDKYKLKLIKKQSKKSIALIEKNNGLIKDILRSQKVKSKIKNVDFKEYGSFYKKIKNNYLHVEEVIFLYLKKINWTQFGYYGIL